MYCPNCGQQQISDEMRFCSRCGLALNGLAEWLAHGGVPARHEDEAQVSASSPRRKGIRRGAKLMFASGVLFPVCLLGLLINHGELMIIPLLIFFVSLVLMLYARLFSDPTPPVKNQDAQTSGLTSMSARGSLPPASSMPGPANLAGQKVRTNELAQPPSVTEHTTRLLDNE